MADERNQRRADIFERGNIYFFYRPAVEEESPSGLQDIQQSYLVLSPEESDVLRLIVVGRKKLPEVEEHGRYWAFVDLVTSDPSELREKLTEDRYQTKTRGERRSPAARPAGEGVYEIAMRDNQTYLAYALELPHEPDEIQRELDIEEEASYVLSIKNPEISSERGLPQRKRAEYPDPLKQQFAGRRWVPADPPDFLDHEGAELLLIGASTDPEGELGVELPTDDESEDTADIFNELRLRKSEHPVAPLFEGEWR